MKKLAFFSFPLVAFLFVSCSDIPEQTSDLEYFSKTNLFGKSIGLGTKELALTLDDGPIETSVALAKYLQKKGVPTTFFVNYKNLSNMDNPQDREKISAMCNMSLHNIGNHADKHIYGSNIWSNLNDVHRIIKTLCPKQNYIFYRAPGGTWSSSKAQGLNDTVDQFNKNVGTQYIGPMFWDITCDTEPDCKSTNWRTLRDNYYSFVARKGKGIILAHDSLSTTVKMLTGLSDLSKLNSDFNDSEGLIFKLQKAGYKFVALDKYKEKISTLLGKEISSSK